MTWYTLLRSLEIVLDCFVLFYSLREFDLWIYLANEEALDLTSSGVRMIIPPVLLKIPYDLYYFFLPPQTFLSRLMRLPAFSRSLFRRLGASAITPVG